MITHYGQHISHSKSGSKSHFFGVCLICFILNQNIEILRFKIKQFQKYVQH